MLRPLHENLWVIVETGGRDVLREAFSKVG